MLSILLISAISTSVFVQSAQSDEPTSFSNSNFSMSNATIANTSPKLPPLEIPSSNATIPDVSPVIPPPPLDMTKVKPCNMTEVKAKMASHPISDENHLIPIHDSNQTEQTLQRQDFNQAQYCVMIRADPLVPVRGVYATRWLDTSFTIDSNAMLYGPTLKGPWPCPLEVSTVYDGWHNVYMIGVWDFSLENPTDWAYYLYFSQAQSYIAQYDQYKFYTVVICKNYWNEWSVLLFNRITWQYDEIYTQANDGPFMDGWDMYEAKWSLGTNYPPTINIRSSDVSIYYWDLIFGWRWVLNDINVGLSYLNDYNTGPLEASGNYRDWNSVYYDWTAGAHYVETITYCGPISGNGNAWDGAKLRGCKNDDQFARIFAGNPGDAGAITARMIRNTHGHIFVNGYGAYGYYNSHLYVYVSQNGQNWTPLNGGNPITINYWDGRRDFYCGYSGGFSYIAFAGYDDNGFSVNLYLDHVFVYYNL